MDSVVKPTGEVVLVTGGAGDIGFAAACRLATPLRCVVLADHITMATQLSQRATELRSLGFSVFETLFDVSDRAEVAVALDVVTERVGTPTLLFNNAGVQGEFQRVDKLSSSDVERVIAVNVIGVFNMIAEVSARMIASSTGGAIVSTASMAGVSGAPNMAAYSASKAAVIALTKSSAKDLAPFGIRANTISPAFIGPGAMWDRQVELQAAAGSQYYATTPDEVSRQMIDMIPLRRYGSLDEVAKVVEFLLSSSASYLTGVNIEIAGGSA
jgi:2-dehydro-3-deoxy-L-rhamnonate dehydrogenase (NAD+)